MLLITIKAAFFKQRWIKRIEKCQFVRRKCRTVEKAMSKLAPAID